MSRLILPSLTAFALFAVSLASAQDLKDFQAKQRIAAEKLTGQVKDALDRSRQLEKTDAIQARIVIQAMLRQVKDSSDLSVRDQDTLVRQLQNRLAQVDEATRARKIVDDQRPLTNPTKPRPPVNDPGKGSSAAAKGFIDPIKNASRTQADLFRERDERMRDLARGDLRSSIPPSGNDIDFPANWKELSKRRLEMVNPKLTAKEAKLLKTLNSVMSPDYKGEEFKAVLNHLQDKTQLTIIVDEASIADLNIDYKDPVTFQANKVTVRTILKKVLGDKGLTYIIKEGSIQVMTPKKASEHTVVRTYQIDDLIQPSQQAMMFGPFMAQAQMMQNAQMLVNMIQMTVEPSYWQPNGPGAIIFYPPTKSLLIRASAEMHYQLASPGLFGGR